MTSNGTSDHRGKGNRQDDGDAVKTEGSQLGEGVNHILPDSVQKATDLTTYALHFLSNASNETLGACFVGLGATTYLVLGRVGLLLIGVVGGVVLQASWDNDTTDKDDGHVRDVGARKRREKGLDIVSRLLDFRNENATSTGTESFSDTSNSDAKDVDFEGFRPETKDALNGFADAVIRDYVKWWYTPLLPKDSLFPSACRKILSRFLLSVSNKLSRKRPADTFLEFLTNSSSIIIVFLSELATALKSTSETDSAAAIHQYVFENPESSLANVLDQEQQDKKLKAIADDVLHGFLDNKAYSCEPVKLFLQQVLASLVLEGTVISCSRPAFINEWIVYALEDEQKSELVQAIDAGVSGATGNGTAVKGIASSAPYADLDDGSERKREHKRTVSQAEAAMAEAMQEAKRLSALIASEEAGKAPAFENSDYSGAITSNSAKPISSPNNVDNNHAISKTLLSDEGEIAENPDNATGFTTFDQILSSQPTTLQNGTPPTTRPVPMTLHNAKVSIIDDALRGERATPTAKYWLQIEPAVSHYPGWMISREYTQFETMHEVLRRIAKISGVQTFTQQHSTLPTWEKKPKSSLVVELESYLRDALTFDQLAESEGMKRFLEKDSELRASPGMGDKGGFGFPSPAAVVGGVAGVFGRKGQKKQISPNRPPSHRNASATNIERIESNPYSNPPKESQERTHSMVSNASQQELFRPSRSLDQPSDELLAQSDSKSISETSNFHSPPQISDNQEPDIILPPPPSEIEDDYDTTPSSPKLSLDESITLRTPPSTFQSSRVTLASDLTPPSKPIRKHEFSPLSTEETSVAVELFFATINELYALSSAWTLRLTLLNAAKSFLLRPGNPNLEAIRQLIQSTLIDSQTNDAAIATHIGKTRENALPTEEELKAWPPPPSTEEKERLRRKARKLLVEKGMPAALTSVMGAAASGEALGKVFDCLQVSEVARGLVFALVLQAVRAVTH